MKNCSELRTKMQAIFGKKRFLQFKALFQKELFSCKDFDEKV